MPKTSVAQHPLVMIRTFSARLRAHGRSSIGRRSLAAEAGDTLLEVLVSALLLGLIVVGTFSGLNSANRATSIDRSRSQADALAEHAEEQLRSEPIKRLVELTESHPLEEHVEENGAKYTIVSTAQYISDATSTSSCTSSSAKADYIQTTSKVSTPLIGAGKSVEENGIISPPAGSALIVQVTESGAPLQGAKVVATGPAPATTTHELETSTNGCAILAVPPGEYEINASKTGYVDPNGYPNTYNDESGSVTRSVYIPAENTSKVGYNLGLAGTLAVKFIEGSSATPTEGDSFVAFNTGMTKPRPFPETFTPGSYSATITSPPTIFPFKTKYTIHAGTCEADLPSANGVPPVESEEKEVTPGSTIATTVRLAPVRIKVMSGYSGAHEGEPVETATGSTTDGCGAKRSFTSTPLGALPHPGLPFGKYSMCVGAKIGVTEKKWETISTSPLENNGINGPTSTTWTNGKTNVSGIATIYLGLAPSGTPSGAGTVSEGHC
jgi:Tfp pilus assembly protein PilV